MSGGSGADRRRKVGGAGGRGQGWEEAGGEFYQESYPGGGAGCSEADFDSVLHRDAAHLATMLPSKQAQHTLARATVGRRGRNEGNKSTRKRSSTRSRFNTVRRESAVPGNDVHVSMLPDFTENFPNEERTWEEIMQIKSMPVSMAQKRELKSKLQNATKLRLQGFEQLKWQRRKFWQHFKSNWKEFYSKFELWQSSLKTIEGNFGIGVVAYFLFIKWLMFLNLAIFLLIFIIVVLPTILFEETKYTCTPAENNNTYYSTSTTSYYMDTSIENNNTYDTTATVSCCSEMYSNMSTTRDNNTLLDLIQGTGWMENTLLFYGYYTDETYTIDQLMGIYYSLPLAYVGVTVSVFMITLILIVKSSARGFKERLVEGEGQFYQYCNLIFGGWDFCIDNQRGAVNKHKAIYKEIKGYLEAERFADEKRSRSKPEKIRLFFKRIFIHITILIVLAAAAFLIYYTFNESTQKIKETEELNHTEAIKYLLLFYEFLPYLVIVSLNLTVPFLFSFLVTYEHYAPTFVVRITLFRTIFLRLASLGVLSASIYIRVNCSDEENEISCECNKRPICWETYVGQQFYKLSVTDTVINIAVTFFINFPRAFLARHINANFFKFIGEQQFELPKHVLDVVYSQTVCWIGTFFTPLLPALAFLNCFIMFYVKKFACLINSTPSSTVYRASRSHSMFMAVLLVSFALATIVVGFSFAEIIPSKSCGPFRGKSYVWELVIETFAKLPEWMRDTVDFLGTAGFAVPVIVILFLALYYYTAVSSANRHMVVVLKQQLVLEGHDKQFLLSRLSSIIKQQQTRMRIRTQSAAPDLSVATTDSISDT